MGNNMGRVVGSSKAAKVMKINGEYFKIKTPTKVIDIIKDYPHHILLDSQDFLRFNLRAKPLHPDDQLKPRKIYLLVELPKFPDDNINQSPLRKVRSGVLKTSVTKDVMMMMKEPQRSVSDLTVMMRSMGARNATCFNDGGSSYSGGGSPVGPTRVKMRLPKGEVQKIMEESGDDDVEVAKKIVRLYLEENAAVSSHGNVAVHVEERECREAGRKYKKLSS